MDLLTPIINNGAEYSHKIMAIYLRGSRMRGSHTEQSDYDVTVVYSSSKRELLFNSSEGRKFRMPESHIEGVVISTVRLFQLLDKGACNTLEYIHTYPSYVHPDFKPIADFLYHRRSQILASRKCEFIRGTLGMANNNLNVARKDSSKPKTLFYMQLFLEQAKVALRGENLDFCVPLSQDWLENNKNWENADKKELFKEVEKDVKDIEGTIPGLVNEEDGVLDELADLIIEFAVSSK